MDICPNMDAVEAVRKLNQLGNVFAILRMQDITIFNSLIITCEMLDSVMESRVDYPIEGVNTYIDLYIKIFGPVWLTSLTMAESTQHRNPPSYLGQQHMDHISRIF